MSPSLLDHYINNEIRLMDLVLNYAYRGKIINYVEFNIYITLNNTEEIIMNMKDLIRIKIYKKSVRRVLLSLLLTCLSFPTLAKYDDQPIQQDKNLLIDLINLIELSHELNGFNDNKNDLSTLINNVETRNMDDIFLFKNRNNYQWMRSQIDEMIQEARFLFDLKEQEEQIGISTKDSDPIFLAACSAVTPASSYVALGAQKIADLAIKSAKFSCHQQVLGEDDSATCIPFEIIAQAAKSGYEFVEFCNREGVYAYDFSVFKIMKKMIEHMNEFIDDTQISSRATATSTEALQDALDGANTNLNESFPIINNKLNIALTGLNQSNNQVNNINAQATSLLQRVQINQLEIENTAISTSDVQQTLLEARSDTQAIISALSNSQTLMNEMSFETQALLKQNENSQIELVLASSTANANLIYQIPGFKGGLLDRAREILIVKMLAIDTAGGKISEAKDLFNTGNSHYNKQQYKSAYVQYSLAYKSLLESSF
jgi:hypothetical protein